MAKRIETFELTQHKQIYGKTKEERISDVAFSGILGGAYGGIQGSLYGRVGAARFAVRRLDEKGVRPLTNPERALIGSKPRLMERFGKKLLQARKISRKGITTSEQIMKRLMRTGARRGAIVGAAAVAIPFMALNLAIAPGAKKESEKVLNRIAAGKMGTPKQQDDVRKFLAKVRKR